jgi:hypothetical protein
VLGELYPEWRRTAGAWPLRPSKDETRRLRSSAARKPLSLARR